MCGRQNKKKVLIIICLLLFIAIGYCYSDNNSDHIVVPIENNFLISSDTGFDAIGGRPAIAVDGTNFFVVWCVSSVGTIYGARVSQDGTVLDIAGIAISADSGMPSVAFGDSCYFVVWVNSEIYGARVTQDGSVLDPTPIQITSGGNPKVKPISIAFNGTNFLITWRTTSDKIYGIRVTEEGVPLDNPGGFEIGTGFYPWVDSDSANYMVVWHKWGNGLDIYGARVTADGNVLDPGGFPICTADDDQDHASVACGDTNYFVAWHDWRGGNQYNHGSAYGARLSIDGTVLDNPAIKIANYTREQVPVIVTFDGTDYLAAWHEDNMPANFRLVDVFGRRVSTDGIILDEKAISISTSHGHQWGPRIAFNNNKFLVVWNDELGRCYDGCIYGQLLEKQLSVQYTSHPTNDNDREISTLSKRFLNQADDEWSIENSPTNDAIYDIWGLNTNIIYAVGEGCQVIRYNDSEWVFETQCNRGRVYSIWGDTPNSIWITGWCWGIAHYNGSNWSTMDCQNDGIGMGIWGTSSTDVLAVGARTNCLQYDGINWNQNPTDVYVDLWDIWGISSDNIYAVGEFGTVIRYDGYSWNKLLNITTNQSLNAIWGNSLNDIFIVGDFGTILHYDGTSWNFQDSGTTEHLFGVWGFNSSNVYAVGLNGTILRYNGSSWNTEISGTDMHLLDVWGVGNNIWVVGDHGIILKKGLPFHLISYNFMETGWYMISLPVIPEDSSVTTLFPTVLGSMAFGWDPTGGMYSVETEIKTKYGYWIAIPGATTDQVCGEPLDNYTIHCGNQGWYMIGSVLGSTDFSDPDDDPDNQVLSPAFGWNTGTGSYYTTTTLDEKNGYWAAVFGACDLTVGGGGSGSGLSKSQTESHWNTFSEMYGSTPPAPPDGGKATGEMVEVPTGYGLLQNTPNPFNPETTIRFQLPEESHLILVVYNTMGQEIKRLVDGDMEAGYHDVVWDGRNEFGDHVSSGVYIVMFQAGEYVQTKKILFVQ